MRWGVTLSKRLRTRGYRKPKCDVRTFAKYDSGLGVAAFLVRRGDDMLFT